MEKYGFLVTYGNCTGCLKCVAACRETHTFETDDSQGEICGIKVVALRPFDRGGKTRARYHVIPTAFCDRCESETITGRPPFCIERCPEKCIEFGMISELAKKLTGRKMALVTL